jgi:hypothetical protein
MLKKPHLILPIILFSCTFIGCASVQAANDLNTTPENLARGDPANSIKVKEYLQNVLETPEDYEIKAYHRKAYSADTRKTIFIFHSYYVIFNKKNMEHTLVFTATPKGSVQNGSWMFDAQTDVDSYNLYVTANNPWDVVEFEGPNGKRKLDTIKTVNNILERLEKGYKFFGGAIVRDLAWYHQIWLFLVPPPGLTYGPLLIMSINKDNCSTAVLDTMAWE